MITFVDRPETSRNAAFKAVWAAAAVLGAGGGGSVKCIVPVTIPFPPVLVPDPTYVFVGAIAKPVIELPGLSPRSAVPVTALIVVAGRVGVFVTVAPARTP